MSFLSRKIRNKLNNLINPATEDKQDDIIEAVSNRVDLEGLGNLSVGITQTEIVITGEPHSIRIRAATTNTGIIFIGEDGILSDGSNDFVRLESGDEIVINYNDTTNALYAISDTADQKINIGILL